MADNNSITAVLLRQWNDGDEQGLHGLLERHLPWIQNHVHRRLGGFLRAKGETGDYVQDSMLEFLRYGPRISIHDEEHFRALIVRIVENTLRGRRKWYVAQRRRISREQPLASDTVLSLDPPRQKVERPSEAAQQNEREAWIRLGLELLDPDDHEIIVLHQWDEQPFEEIGNTLQISSDAARMRHSRAMNRLAQKVSNLRKGDLPQALGIGNS